MCLTPLRRIIYIWWCRSLQPRTSVGQDRWGPSQPEETRHRVEIRRNEKATQSRSAQVAFQPVWAPGEGTAPG